MSLDNLEGGSMPRHMKKNAHSTSEVALEWFTHKGRKARRLRFEERLAKARLAEALQAKAQRAEERRLAYLEYAYECEINDLFLHEEGIFSELYSIDQSDGDDAKDYILIDSDPESVLDGFNGDSLPSKFVLAQA